MDWHTEHFALVTVQDRLVPKEHSIYDLPAERFSNLCALVGFIKKLADDVGNNLIKWFTRLL